jgi:hypothetical protein
LINEADLPVVMRYACNLASTSKAIDALVNHPDATCIFLESLSKKYGAQCGEMAVTFNTKGARKWIWNNIPRWGHDRLYKVIQDLSEVITTVFEEAKKDRLLDEYSLSRSPLFFEGRSEFAFAIQSHSVGLRTPLGYTIFTHGKHLDVNTQYTLGVKLIKRLNALFTGQVSTGPLFEVTADETGTRFEKRTIRGRAQSESMRGTQNLIASLSGNSVFYTIRAINGQNVPTLELMHSDKLNAQIIQMLEAHRLGHDPIVKPSKAQAELKITQEPLFKNVADVLRWAIEIIAEFQKQRDTPNRLPVRRSEEASALYYLHCAAQNFFEIHIGYILTKYGGKYMHGCVMNSIDLKALLNAYESVIRKLGQNWQRLKLIDHPHMRGVYSEEDYVLFGKETATRDDCRLLEDLSKLLNVPIYTQLDNRWWIRKDRLNETLAALNINLGNDNELN